MVSSNFKYSFAGLNDILQFLLLPLYCLSPLLHFSFSSLSLSLSSSLFLSLLLHLSLLSHLSLLLHPSLLQPSLLHTPLSLSTPLSFYLFHLCLSLAVIPVLGD